MSICRPSWPVVKCVLMDRLEGRVGVYAVFTEESVPGVM